MRLLQNRNRNNAEVKALMNAAAMTTQVSQVNEQDHATATSTGALVRLVAAVTITRAKDIPSVEALSRKTKALAAVVIDVDDDSDDVTTTTKLSLQRGVAST